MSGNGRAIKRVLVLTSATGAGHDTHAQATADWCARMYGPGVEVRIEHCLEDSHRFYRFAVSFYNFIQRRMPWFHHLYYNVIELLDVLNPGTVGLGRDYYVRLLREVRPNVVLSVMDCLNRGYFELAKSVLGPEVQCATYCPEFVGGYGFSRNWVNPRGDFFLARTEEGREEAIRRGFAAERALAVGHWELPDFYDPGLSEEEKAAYLVEALNLRPGRFTLLLSTGGSGAQNHAALLQALAPLGDRLQVIALCGREARARKKLEEWARAAVPFPVRALGFSTEMRNLLQVSSAVVARAGATTAGEALLCACPVIFNGLRGMMPQELPTWRYFERRGIGRAIYRAAAIAAVVGTLLDDAGRLEAMRTRMREVRDARTPEANLRRLFGGSFQK